MTTKTRGFYIYFRDGRNSSFGVIDAGNHILFEYTYQTNDSYSKFSTTIEKEDFVDGVKKFLSGGYCFLIEPEWARIETGMIPVAVNEKFVYTGERTAIEMVRKGNEIVVLRHPRYREYCGSAAWKEYIDDFNINSFIEKLSRYKKKKKKKTLQKTEG